MNPVPRLSENTWALWQCGVRHKSVFCDGEDSNQWLCNQHHGCLNTWYLSPNLWWVEAQADRKGWTIRTALFSFFLVSFQVLVFQEERLSVPSPGTSPCLFCPSHLSKGLKHPYSFTHNSPRKGSLLHLLSWNSFLSFADLNLFQCANGLFLLSHFLRDWSIPTVLLIILPGKAPHCIFWGETLP